ncbi:type II toxin-antitoxin system death-on-curing family toxin [Paenibacillus sp. YYML68]|uniref:type II toxin-antitoxin system death-on-curing family toxin n=1 Tax=Paenibacillus sp. YYML68 TaxID=2909250 RepID=UPI002493A567|nr:type II toxin-antitoxin system death-on-curing family toxin [Paenibacillus sp. YYML68]
MNHIEVDDIIRFHAKIVAATGGSNGIRDRALIESAIQKAFVTFDEQDLYEGVLKKISVIAYSLVKNHGFVDGNKRIGVASMLLLLRLNDIKVEYSQKELIDLGLGIAEGKLKEEDIEQWIIGHQV